MPTTGESVRPPGSRWLAPAATLFRRRDRTETLDSVNRKLLLNGHLVPDACRCQVLPYKLGRALFNGKAIEATVRLRV